MGLNKLIRLRKVDQTLKGLAGTNSVVKAALNDFKSFSDERYSEFEKELNTFFKELESSGVLTAMAEQASIGQSLQSTKNTFAKLYNTIFKEGNVPVSDDLYCRMSDVFKVSLKEMCSDPALALIVASLNENISSRLSGLEQALEQPKEISGPFASYDLLAGFLSKMTKILLGQYKTIRIETNKGAKLVDLQKVYIPSKVKYKSELLLAERLTALEQDGGKKDRPILGDLSEKDDTGLLPYAELQRSLRRAVVLGDPGGGKSTLCQYLCYQLAKQYGFFEQYPDTVGNYATLQSARIPIRVVLRNFEAARHKDPQLGIFEYIVRDIRSMMTCSDEEAKYALEFSLSLGKAVLAFDGLDEILNTAIRREFVTMVSSFCDEYPLCPVLVTSRLVGYEDASLPKEFDELLLEKFDLEEIKNYVTKILKVVAGVKPPQAAQDAVRFMQQTSTSASDLRQNPLLLGLMAFIFANKGDVPTNRPEIYQECAIMMFEKWDQNRNIRADIPAGFDLLHLFSEIAAKIYGNAELEEGVDEEWLRKFNRSYFKAQFEDTAKSIEAGKKVTTFVKGRSWVMSEFGADVYRFTHRTFLEYFFARHLNEHQETVGDIASVIIPKVIEKQWDVISHLALQLKTFRNQRRTSQAIVYLSEQLTKQVNSDAALSLAAFTATTLQYLVGPESDIKRLLQSVYAVALGNYERDNVAALRLLTACSQCQADRREYVHSVLGELLVETIREKTDSGAEFAIAAALSGDRHQPASRSQGYLLPTNIVKQVRGDVRQVIRDRSYDPFYAGICWEWYGVDFEENFQKHNFAMVTSVSKPYGIVSILGDPGVRLMRPSSLYGRGDHGDPSWISRMRTVGKLGDMTEGLNFSSDKLRRYILTPPAYWINAVGRVKSDPEALRGVIMCMIIHLRFMHGGGATGGYWASFAARGGRAADAQRLATAIDAALSSVKDSKVDFDFWREERPEILKMR